MLELTQKTVKVCFYRVSIDLFLIRRAGGYVERIIKNTLLGKVSKVREGPSTSESLESLSDVGILTSSVLLM